MIKRLLIIFSFFIGLVAHAEDVQFSMSAPKIVTVGEQFSLTLSLNAKGNDLRMASLPDFDVLMGPSISSSRNIQSINGKMTQTVSYTYTYILRAKNEGTFTIMPATIESGRKRYQSNSLSIKAIKGKAITDGEKDLFIKFEVDKQSVYKGEMISATFKLYSRVALSVADQTLPSFEGFWTQDIDLPSAEQTRTQEAVDGVIYNVYTLQKKVLIPQQTGNLSIEPAELIVDVQQRVRSNNPFDDFFGSTRRIRTTVKSDRVSINVKALPPAPTGFKGAVGQFSINSSIDKTNIAANEAITINVRVDGNGNLKHINAFDFKFPADFEVYDPKTSYNYRASDKGIIGSTSFEQVVIPRFAGEFTIPAYPFVYFDPASQSYKTTRTREFVVRVEKGTEEQNATVISSLSKENIRFIGQDIKYIKQGKLKLSKKDSFIFGSLPFYGSYAIASLIFALIIVVKRKKARENANVALMRNKKASKMARKHLKEARTCVRENKQDAFYDALLRAFWGYLSDKLTIPRSELNRDNVRNTLLENNVDESTLEDFIKLIDACEMAKFAPTAIEESIEELYEKAKQLLAQFDKQIKKKA